MRIAFIGGNGHHYLKGALSDTSLGRGPVAVAGDGFDDPAAKRNFENISKAAGAERVQWFDDHRQMLDAFKPDFVNVGAVYGHNAQVIAAVLERNIPVVSDKPVAASWEQLDTLRRLCQDPRRVLITEFPFRSKPEFNAAREAVAAGLLGEIVLATAQKSYRFGERPAWYANRADYGGTLLWVSSHAIDIIHYTTGKRFVRAWGRQGNVSKPEFGTMEDHTLAVFEMEGGATALVHADYLRPAAAATHGDDRLRLAGSKGLLEVRDDRCKLITHDQGEQDITDRVKPQPMHRLVLAAIKGDKGVPFSTAQSLSMAAVLLYARDAADQQRFVEIPG